MNWLVSWLVSTLRVMVSAPTIARLERELELCKSQRSITADQLRRCHEEVALLAQERSEANERAREITREVHFLYNELSIAAQEVAKKYGDYNGFRRRVEQLAARRNPEGRQYEGPDGAW